MPRARTNSGTCRGRKTSNRERKTAAPLSEVAALALRTGWHGLELRSAPDEPVHIGLSATGRQAAVEILGGLATLCIASYVKVASGQVSDEQCVSDLLAEAGLAADLGARAVRVFPGGTTGMVTPARSRDFAPPRHNSPLYVPGGTVERPKRLSCYKL
ncbi:hypothetical protein ACFPIJ_00450 [Dactylosporangium cerinum]|uniref:Uncharacterized protein n=1 Tax=Dactylosporangium cerinum TaxID=1434730 RepID=A0ABV9VNX7_9ACTN